MSELTVDDLEGPTSGTAGRRKPSRRAIVLTTLGLLAGIALITWMVFSGTQSSISTQVIGFSVTSAESVTIDFSVTKPKDATVDCTLEALAADYSQIGLVSVRIGPAEVVQQRASVPIPTTQKAVSAVVRSCIEP